MAPAKRAIKSETQPPPAPETDDFAIVAVGASAGGLEAFTQLLQALPADTGMAYVFIQHLDPKHVSLLKELLQRQTSMPVEGVRDSNPVEPNHVYVIPHNANMTIRERRLTLSPRPPRRALNMSIDTFFRSLAADQHSRAIGVILSGTASDGALGVMAIKAEGGITMAQDSETAKFDSMPRSAIASGCVDLVLPPEKIAQELARLGKHPYVIPSQKPAAREPFPETAEGLFRILALLRVQTGIDFTFYRQTTIKRRILRRMALHKDDSVENYAARLRSDTAEVRALFNDILINVTEFFRDSEAFAALKAKVFPKLAAANEGAPIRVWVPGCSTGQEVYSLAIALLEFFDDGVSQPPLQFFGTDISENSLDIARAGIYPQNIARDVSPERLRRFFSKLDGEYQINKRVREICVFARQNVARDPPFSRLDLISCRNVLIYFDAPLQRRIIPLFHYSLKPNGILLLGPSETITHSHELFSLLDKTYKIYVRSSLPPSRAGNFGPPGKTIEIQPLKGRRSDVELQSIIEEQEASNKELRSANEEFQSSNEQLQSTNEELQTAKEELQSTNEELNTVNEELHTRNTQMTQTGNDLLNLIANINIPIVMLGNDLRIRRFTPGSQRVLNLIPSDVGRPINDLRLNIDVSNLTELLTEVIETLTPKVLEVKDWSHRPYSLRIRPYLTVDGKIDGVVMVLVDLDTPHVSGDGHLRIFTQSLLAAQEEERRKVARELHDELNQKLALLELDVESLEKKPPPSAKLRGYLKSFRQKVSELSDDLRRIAYQLHPSVIDDLGLVVALRSYCRDLSEREGLPVSFHSSNVPGDLPPAATLMIYRVVQEALRNVVKHSGAREAQVILRGLGDRLQLRIEDAGRGFEVQDARGSGGLGLTSIEERVALLGGTVEIQAKPEKGSKIIVQIPLNQSRDGSAP